MRDIHAIQSKLIGAKLAVNIRPESPASSTFLMLIVLLFKILLALLNRVPFGPPWRDVSMLVYVLFKPQMLASVARYL